MGSGSEMLIAVVSEPTGRMEKMSLDEEGVGVVTGSEVTSELTSTVLLLDGGPGGVTTEAVGVTDTVTVTVSPGSLLSGLFKPKIRSKKSLVSCNPVCDLSHCSITSKKLASGASSTARAAAMSAVDVSSFDAARGAGSATALAILATSSTVVSEQRAARELEGDMIAAPNTRRLNERVTGERVGRDVEVWCWYICDATQGIWLDNRKAGQGGMNCQNGLAQQTRLAG